MHGTKPDDYIFSQCQHIAKAAGATGIVTTSRMLAWVPASYRGKAQDTRNQGPAKHLQHGYTSGIEHLFLFRDIWKSPKGLLRTAIATHLSRGKEGMDGWRQTRWPSVEEPVTCLQLELAQCPSQFSLLPWAKSADRIHCSIWELWRQESIVSRFPHRVMAPFPWQHHEPSCLILYL